jgi:hypothetical protein
MKLNKKQMNVIEEFCDRNELNLRKAYSGRNMFGRTCIGIVCDNIVGVSLELAVDLQENGMNDLIQLMVNASWDSMGRQSIVYFPSLQCSDEGEDGEDEE